MARYYRRGVSKIRFLTGMAGATPTRAEINGSTDLSPHIADIDGFSFSNEPIETPDLATSFTSQVTGPDSAEDSSLTFYDDNASATVRTALAKGQAGHMLLLPYGDTATKRGEVWPVTSTGVNDQWTLGDDAAQFVVQFAITGTPNQSWTIPA